MAPVTVAFVGAAGLAPRVRLGRVSVVPSIGRSATGVTAAAAARRRRPSIRASAASATGSGLVTPDASAAAASPAQPPVGVKVEATEAEADAPTRLAAKRAAAAAAAEKRAADRRWLTDVAAKLAEITATLEAPDSDMSEEEREDARVDVYMLRKTAADTQGVLAAGAAEDAALALEIEALEAEVRAA